MRGADHLGQVRCQHLGVLKALCASHVFELDVGCDAELSIGHLPLGRRQADHLVVRVGLILVLVFVGDEQDRVDNAVDLADLVVALRCLRRRPRAAQLPDRSVPLDQPVDHRRRGRHLLRVVLVAHGAATLSTPCF